MYLVITGNSFFWLEKYRKTICKFFISYKKKWYVIFTFSGIKVKNGTYKFTDNDKLSLEKK